LFKNKLNITKNRSYLSLIITIIIFFIVLIVSWSNFLYIFNKKIQDLYFVFNDVKISKDIVVVEIDENTLS
jgi:CHASE2 domain-containing sensor protein